MVDQLSSFADEVTRVAREVGTEGKLGGQAQVEGVSGTWKDLTDNVNFMASNLTGQVRNIADVDDRGRAAATSRRRSPSTRSGEILELKNTLNTMVDQLSSFADEVTRVAREVGTEGKLGGQAQVQGVSRHLARPHRQRQLHGRQPHRARCATSPQVTTAVANGDLSKKITVDVRGEIAELKETINTMVDQLRSFAAEVTRVAREVGTEGTPRRSGDGRGRLRHVEGPHRQRQLHGRQPDEPGARTSRRSRPRSRTATCRKKITVDVKGEILELKDTINTMVDTLRSFADEVTRVAKEVGTEGKLGGQARRAGRVRHLEGPHRQRQPARRQPDDAGARDRRRDDRGRARRPDAEDHRRRERRDPRARSRRSTRWSTSSRRSPTRSRASRARSAPRAASAARRRSRASPARGRA